MTRHTDIHPRQRIELPPPRQRYYLPPAQRENPTHPAAKALVNRERYGECDCHKEDRLSVGEWIFLIFLVPVITMLTCAGLAWLAGWPL